jgi:predicted nucleotidyltransferase
MKKIEEIKNVLIQNRALIKQRFKIDIIGIFGSYIRDRQMIIVI